MLGLRGWQKASMTKRNVLGVALPVDDITLNQLPVQAEHRIGALGSTVHDPPVGNASKINDIMNSIQQTFAIAVQCIACTMHAHA